MRLAHVWTCFLMTARELGRRRAVITLGLALPLVFFGVVFATTGHRLVPVRLAAAVSGTLVNVESRRQSLVFISIAAAGLLSAFFATYLIQHRVETIRRLILCGYRPAEQAVARLLVLIAIVAVTSLYLWGLLALVARPAFPPGVALGVALGALVYGCYGFLVGTLFHRDLETIFAILVLINIDAGWLQNPIYFQSAHSRWLIEALPAHFPAQVAHLAAFTGDPVARLVVGSCLYATALLAAAVTLYRHRVEVRS